jgi:hypothetical protein
MANSPNPVSCAFIRFRAGNDNVSSAFMLCADDAPQQFQSGISTISSPSRSHTTSLLTPNSTPVECSVQPG